MGVHGYFAGILGYFVGILGSFVANGFSPKRHGGHSRSRVTTWLTQNNERIKTRICRGDSVSRPNAHPYENWRPDRSPLRIGKRQRDIIEAENGGRDGSLSGRYPEKYVIGLTGNIAVGKSLVREILADLGAAGIDADHIAHQVIRKGEAAYNDIIDLFGDGILDPHGEIKRAALGEVVFANPARLKQLEGITHPAIRHRIDQLIREAEASVVVIEAIKLLEGDLKNAVDSVWVVDASPETQLQRLMKERGMSEGEAQKRIALQNSQADKLRQADVIIRNDGDA